MATLADSLVSASGRRLPVRRRPDLEAKRQAYLGQSYWIVKDPVGLNYYRFQDEEFFILQQIDGETSLDEIKERFEAEFPPQKITLEELQQFLGMLHRSGLIIAGLPGQGKQLRRRRDERRRKEVLGAMTNILCIRFKGFDPERVLNWLYPKVAWFFHPATMALCLLMAVSALTLVLVEFDVFQSKLPGFYQFFSPTNALLLAVTLGLSKVVHEFGHGLACKHFGGECHEMGVMILVLTPCLYCNVSDSWMLPSKWQRAAIGAAGMYVEVVLASICTFLWWFSEPGLLNNLCLNVMFISSVTTLLFNANPLLRYDGYYILADLVEIPNLRQKATSILSRKLGQWLLGIEPPEDPFLPQRNQIFFALYSVAAAVYRWFVMASILFFMYQVFKPYGLQVIGQAIIAMSLYGLVVMPLYKVAKFFWVPGRIEKVKKPRMYTSLAVIAALVAAVLFVPLPHSVICPVEIQPRNAEPVYIDVAGQLESIEVKPGERVERGQLLAELSNLDVDLELARLDGQLAQHRIRLANLRRQGFRDRQAVLAIPEVQMTLAAVGDQLEQKRTDHRRLQLRAPVDGYVLPPPETPDRSNEQEGRLATWSGTPLKETNLGAFLEQSVMFCQIGDPRRMEAIVVIDQADRNYIRGGQVAEIKLDNLPHDILLTHVTSIAESELESVSPRMSTSAGGEVATLRDPDTGEERPQSTAYQARAPLGLYGRAKDGSWLRGRLEPIDKSRHAETANSADSGTPDDSASADGPSTEDPADAAWQLRYLPADLADTDPEHGGVVPLVGPGVPSDHLAGQFVELSGEWGEEGWGYRVASARRLDPANGLLQIGLRGRAKIHTDWIPLGTRLWRFITHTFNFRI